MVRTVVRTSPAQPFQWTFLTNHAHVLVLLARNPDALLRELADAVGITERAVQRIVAELVDCGYVESERVGRRNRYRIRADRPLRHPVEASTTVKQLLELLR
jgi:DNA-binding MarR family transcriptional regulator